MPNQLPRQLIRLTFILIIMILFNFSITKTHYLMSLHMCMYVYIVGNEVLMVEKDAHFLTNVHTRVTFTKVTAMLYCV